MKKLIVILTLLWANVSYAEQYNLYWNQVPAVCGTPDEIKRYIDDKGFEPVHISLGRVGSTPDGEPIYMITYYETKDQVLVTVDIPSATDSCILFHTYNKSKVLEKKKGI